MRCSPAPPQPDYALVVQDDEGRILATLQPEPEIGPEQSFIWCFPAVHPEARGTGIERLLLQRLWQQASEWLPEIPSESVYLYVHCGAHQGQRAALCESFGLQLKRSRPHMAYYPLENLARPQAPPGIELRPYSRGTDDESAVDTLNQAFADNPDSVGLTRGGVAPLAGCARLARGPQSGGCRRRPGGRPLPVPDQRRSNQVDGPQRRLRRHNVRAAVTSAEGRRGSTSSHWPSSSA